MSVDKPFGMPDLPDDWHWDYFEKLCKRVSVGHVGETSSYFTTKEQGIPFIRSQNVRPGKLVLDDIKYVTHGFHDKSKKSQLLAGDILIVRVGQNRGDCCVLPKNTGEINCANIVFGRLKNLKYSNYIGYFFNSVLGRAALMAVSSGSAQGVLNTKAIAKVVVPVPPEDIADEVGCKLTSFDNKIELNNQINQTLEQIAQAIFKSWFVDFEPVKAKIQAKQNDQDPERAAMCAISGKTEEELDQLPTEQLQQLTTTAALFPDELEESALGEIPKRWCISEVGDIANIIDCLHAKKPERTEKNTGNIFLQLNNISADSLLSLDEVFYISDEDYKKWVSRIEVSEGDCVITNVGRVGAVAQIPRNVKAALGRNMTAICCKPDMNHYYFLITLLTSRYLKREIEIRTDVGTILNALNVRNIPKLRFINAGSEILQSFEKYVSSLQRRRQLNIEESRSLSQIRDSLLPELISGVLVENLHKEAV